MDGVMDVMPSELPDLEHVSFSLSLELDEAEQAEVGEEVDVQAPSRVSTSAEVGGDGAMRARGRAATGTSPPRSPDASIGDVFGEAVIDDTMKHARVPVVSDIAATEVSGKCGGVGGSEIYGTGGRGAEEGRGDGRGGVWEVIRVSGKSREGGVVVSCPADVSVEDAKVDGVCPAGRGTRGELKLSEEEMALAGAPQGPVYQMKLLETNDFEASPTPEDEMQAVMVAFGGEGDWAALYRAVDSARRLMIFHRDVLAKEGNMAALLGLLTVALGKLRSSTVRNALLGVGDMFKCLGTDMGAADVRPVIEGTLKRLAGDNRFICQEAAQAMETAIQDGPTVEVLNAILPAFCDRNAKVAAKAACYVERCVAALGIGDAEGKETLPGGLDTMDLAGAMARGRDLKLSEGRSASKRTLLRLRKGLGVRYLRAILVGAIGPKAATALVSSLATGKEGQEAQGGKGGPSVRERMMALGRHRGEKRAVAVAAGEGLVFG